MPVVAFVFFCLICNQTFYFQLYYEEHWRNKKNKPCHAAGDGHAADGWNPAECSLRGGMFINLTWFSKNKLHYKTACRTKEYPQK